MTEIDRLSGGRYIAVSGDSDGNPPEFNHRMAAQAYPSAGLADARALDDMLNRARVHHVKISNFWADAHATGKNWEIRNNDRDYEVGDRLVMHAADGRVISTKVLHVWWSVADAADLGLCIAAGWVILDVSPGFTEVKDGDEVLIDLQTTTLTLGEVIERIESLRHSPRIAGHHITIDGDAHAVVLRVGEV